MNIIYYYNEDDSNDYNIFVELIPLEESEVLLTKYNGTNKNVTVPDTYIVDDKTYNLVILSNAYLISDDGEVDTENGIFYNNQNIESVYLGNNIKVVITNVPGENYLEGETTYLFSGCTSLVNDPEIPSSVTNMYGKFRN